MEEILPIGPDEWEKGVELYLVEFPGHDVDGLRQKYTSIHQKKATTVNPNMSEEMSLAKKVKYMTGDWAQLRGGEKEYDMLSYRFDSGEKDDMTPPVVNITADVDEEASTLNNSRRIVGLKVKQLKRAKNPGILTIMMM